MLFTLIVPVMCESFSDFPLVLMSAMTNFIFTELSKQTVVIENRGRVSHPEVAWTVLRLDLGERILHMAKCDGGESGGGVGG